MLGFVVLLYHLNKDSSYYCDYFDQNTSSRYSIRGGTSIHMYKCGAFYISVYNSVNGAAWSIGATISFKSYIKLRVLHMLFEVVTVVLNYIVVSFVFASELRFLGQTGTLAPPYHLNLYI